MAINATPAPMASRPARAAAKAPLEEDKSEVENRRAPSPKSGTALALEMHDDLSALVASLQRRRRDDGDTPVAARSWVDQVLEEQAQDKLLSLKQALLGGAGANGLRDAVARLFPDPSDAVLVLRALLDDEELRAHRDELEALLQELTENNPVMPLRAGINCAIRARLSARQFHLSAKALRQSYRDFLGAALDATSLYELWVEQYGFERRSDIVDFIEQALIADMYALDPSCSRLEFGSLLQAVRKLTVVRSADNLLMLQCWDAPMMQRIGVSRKDLLFGMLGIARNGGGFPELFAGALAGVKYGLSQQEKSLLAHLLRRAIRLLPHGIWFDVSFQVRALDEIELLVQGAMLAEQAVAAPGLKVRA